MSRDRVGRGPVWAGWLTGLLALCMATTAQALPVDVFFDGALYEDEPGDPSRFGMSQAQAFDVRDDFGIPILGGFQFIGSVETRLEVTHMTDPTFDSTPNAPSGNRAESDWTVTNVTNRSFEGATYTLFTHSDPFVKEGVTIDYLDANIGITIDKDLGWVIVRAVDPTMGGGTYYYPAILLDRSVENPLHGVLPGMTDASPFEVAYIVNEALDVAPIGSQAYQLPELQIGMAFVPEPSTGVLFALGLLGLAARRPRS